MRFLKIIILGVAFFSLDNSFGYQNSEVVKYQDSIQREVTKLSDSLRAQKFYNASYHALTHFNDLTLARTYADSSLYYAKISNFKDSEAKSYFQFGVIERAEGNYEKALKYLEKNIEYFKNDSTLVAYSLFQVGVIHRRMGDYQSSLKTYLEILDIFERKKDSFAIASTLNSIGNIYGEMNDYDEAIENFEQALSIFQAKNSLRDIANAYENIGKMRMQKSDTTAAIIAFEDALRMAKKTNEDYQIARILFVLSDIFALDQPELSFDYLNQSKLLFEKINFQRDLIPVYQKLGAHYLNSKNTKKALEFYTLSLKLAKQFKEKPFEKDAYKGLYKAHLQQGNLRAAITSQSNYISLKDSLMDETNFKAISELKKQFETEKKNATIKSQQLALAENENKITQQRMTTYFAFGIAICLLALTIASWLIFKQRQKRKDQELLTLKNEAQVNALESLIEGEEKERLRIAKELHDGVNGDLSAIKHKLNTLLEMNNKTIEEAVVMIDKSCEQVRAISHNLVPPALENFDLQTAAADYCTNMNAIHKPEIVFEFIGQSLHLPKIIEVNIFRIIQELVTNAIKHANATNIDIQLSSQDDNLQLSVDDNGVGFDLVNTNGDGVGLSNIKNRAAFLNAEIDISSSEKGTSVNLFMDKTTFKID